MNYRAAFPEKKILENTVKKTIGFWGTYPLIFTLSGQNYDSKNYDLKSRLSRFCHQSLDFS